MNSQKVYHYNNIYVHVYENTIHDGEKTLMVVRLIEEWPGAQAQPTWGGPNI